MRFVYGRFPSPGERNGRPQFILKTIVMAKTTGKNRAQKKKKFIYKSSVDGRIVTKTYADKNPETTFKERTK